MTSKNFFFHSSKQGCSFIRGTYSHLPLLGCPPLGSLQSQSPNFHLSNRSFFGNSTKNQMKIFNFLPLFLLFFRVFYDLASRQFHSKYLTKGAPKLGYSIQYFNNVIFYILYIHLSYIFFSTTKTVRPASRRK